MQSWDSVKWALQAEEVQVLGAGLGEVVPGVVVAVVVEAAGEGVVWMGPVAWDGADVVSVWSKFVVIAGHVEVDGAGVTGAAVVAVTGSVAVWLVEPVKHKVNRKFDFWTCCSRFEAHDC